jgi:glycosyltransferase involved in cell wall biosynthesis
MAPVPVLHVCDKFGVRGSSIHGVSRLFAWWFPRYDPARFRVTLCGLKAPEPASEMLSAQGVPVVHLGRGRFDARILPDLVALGRRLGARVLHVHGYAAADFGRLAARALGARLVLHEHFADPRLPRYQALADWLLRGLTDQAIAVSESTRTFLVRERHVPAERVALIWNGAPLDEFAPRPRPETLAVRRELGLPEDAFLVGCVGRLSEQKGHRYLLEAFAQLAPLVPDARLLIVGDGDLAGALHTQAGALGIGARVCFAGHRGDVARVLGALDVLAIASTYEGTPLALFEALAAGKAIVSTAVDGCAEILRDGETGLLVPARDPAALAAALLRVAHEPDLRARLASAARAASVRYDVRTCVAEMEALYERLLAPPEVAR